MSAKENNFRWFAVVFNGRRKLPSNNVLSAPWLVPVSCGEAPRGEAAQENVKPP
jgi:hypothetical protein